MSWIKSVPARERLKTLDKELDKELHPKVYNVCYNT